jgi:hypothetical protein
MKLGPFATRMARQWRHRRSREPADSPPQGAAPRGSDGEVLFDHAAFMEPFIQRCRNWHYNACLNCGADLGHADVFVCDFCHRVLDREQ